MSPRLTGSPILLPRQIHKRRALITGPTATYLNMPGSNGDYASTPDAAANSITGDIDLRMDLICDDWTPAAGGAFFGKYQAGDIAYLFFLNAAGTFRWVWSADGTNGLLADSTAAPTVTDGNQLQVRITMDVDNGSAQRDIKFYTRAAGTDLAVHTGWTQLGATVTQAGTTSIFNATCALEIGSWLTGSSPTKGKIYRALILSGIDGTVNCDFDPRRAAPRASSVLAVTGETYTKQGNAAFT